MENNSIREKDEKTLKVYSGSIITFYLEFLPYKHPQVGFESPLLDGTSYEAESLPTKPPRPNSLTKL